MQITWWHKSSHVISIPRKHQYYIHASPWHDDNIIWVCGKFHENSCIVTIACARTRTDRVRKVCSKCQHAEAGFLLVLACVSQELASVRVHVYMYVTCSRLKYCSSLPGRCTTRYCWKHRSENFSVWIYPRVPQIWPYGYTLVPLHSEIPWHPQTPIQSGGWI